MPTVNCITPAASRTHGIGSKRSMKVERSYNGITAQDVLDIFPGAKIIITNKPQSCDHCSKDNIPEWRRGGKIVLRTWPDGRTEWCCHYCGRNATAKGLGLG